MEDPPEITGERLRRLRLALEYEDQVDFAKSLRVDKGSYNLMEKGRRRISHSVAVRLREVHGISLDFIYFGEGLQRLPYNVVIRFENAA